MYKFLSGHVFQFVEYIFRNRISESYGNSMFIFLRTHWIVFHSSCIIVHAHQQCMRILFYLHPHQHLLFFITKYFYSHPCGYYVIFHSDFDFHFLSNQLNYFFASDMGKVFYFIRMWLPSTICWKDCSPIRWSWCPCGKQFTIYVWVYFWILNFIPLICMSVLEPVSPCFDYYCFVVNFEIGKFSYFALFQYCFGYSGPWKLNMNFTIMSSFIKILPGILFFCWICISVWGVLLSYPY